MYRIAAVVALVGCGRVGFDPLIVGEPDAIDTLGPRLVQEATNHAANTATLSATLSNAPTNGHLLVMIGGNVDGLLSTVSGGGATWTLAVESLTHENVEIWVGVTNGSSSTITIARTGSTFASTMWVGEWAGLATTDVVDAAIGIDGTTSPASPGTIITVNPHDLLLFGVSTVVPNTFGTPTPGTWTALAAIESPETNQSAWYRVVSSVGTFAPQVPATGAGWDAAVVALKIAP